MEETNYQERFDKFRDGVFKYVVKSDIIKLGNSKGIKVKDVVLYDKFSINDYNGKIYLWFVISYEGNLNYGNRIVQEFFAERIEKSLDMFYPSNEFTILAANIILVKL